MNGAPWWAVIAAGLTGAVIAFGGTLLSGWRQNRQGRREEWFRRVQWAQSLTATDNDAVREAGYRILLRLSQSDLAQPDDVGLVHDLQPEGEFSAVTHGTDESLADTTFVRDTEQDDEEQS